MDNSTTVYDATDNNNGYYIIDKKNKKKCYWTQMEAENALRAEYGTEPIVASILYRLDGAMKRFTIEANKIDNCATVTLHGDVYVKQGRRYFKQSNKNLNLNELEKDVGWDTQNLK